MIYDPFILMILLNMSMSYIPIVSPGNILKKSRKGCAVFGKFMVNRPA